RQRDCQDRGFILVKQKDVPRGKEKGAILAVVQVGKINRPSHGSTKVVEDNLRLKEWVALCVASRKRIRSVKVGVTVELIDVAVDVVGARLQNDVHYGAARAAIFGRETVVHDIELRNGIWRGVHHYVLRTQRCVEAAVQVPCVRSALAAVGADARPHQMLRVRESAKLAIEPEKTPRGPGRL